MTTSLLFSFDVTVLRSPGWAHLLGAFNAMQPLILLTSSEVAGQPLFRASRIELALRPGTGQLWLNVSHARRFTEVWQEHLRHLQATGRRAFPHLAWDSTDLFVQARAKALVLDGRSASLPVFLAWLSLLVGRPLPDPFLATGVALDSECLLPAPEAFIQGKLEVAEALTVQLFPSRSSPVPFWYPAGSEVHATKAPHLALRPVSTLLEAAEALLGTALEPTSTLQEHPAQEGTAS